MPGSRQGLSSTYDTWLSRSYLGPSPNPWKDPLGFPTSTPRLINEADDLGMGQTSAPYYLNPSLVNPDVELDADTVVAQRTASLLQGMDNMYRGNHQLSDSKTMVAHIVGDHHVPATADNQSNDASEPSQFGDCGGHPDGREAPHTSAVELETVHSRLDATMQLHAMADKKLSSFASQVDDRITAMRADTIKANNTILDQLEAMQQRELATKVESVKQVAENREHLEARLSKQHSIFESVFSKSVSKFETIFEKQQDRKEVSLADLARLNQEALVHQDNLNQATCNSLMDKQATKYESLLADMRTQHELEHSSMKSEMQDITSAFHDLQANLLSAQGATKPQQEPILVVAQQTDPQPVDFPAEAE